jgi:hypothetical protein
MTLFDLSKKKGNLLPFMKYRKCSGLLEAFVLGLPIVKTGCFIKRHLTSEDIIVLKNAFKDVMLCRPDAPKGKWGNLPRGRDCDANNINKFLDECQLITKDACLLCFEHPSVYFTQNYVDRYKISGAACVLIDWYREITIECVGMGFDVGEITRGINLSHVTYKIDWKDINLPSEVIALRSYVNSISDNKYKDSRKLRIDQLSQWRTAPIENLENYIPHSSIGISELQFKQIMNKCIRPVIKNIDICNIECCPTILINLYENTPHVFEFWYSDR